MTTFIDGEGHHELFLQILERKILNGEFTADLSDFTPEFSKHMAIYIADTVHGSKVADKNQYKMIVKILEPGKEDFLIYLDKHYIKSH